MSARPVSVLRVGRGDGHCRGASTGTGEEEHYHAETESHDVELDDFEWGDGHAAVVRDFVDAIRESRVPAVPGREARAAVDLVLAAYAADARGESVAVADVREGRIPETRSDSVGDNR